MAEILFFMQLFLKILSRMANSVDLDEREKGRGRERILVNSKCLKILSTLCHMWHKSCFLCSFCLKTLSGVANNVDAREREADRQRERENCGMQ